MAAIFLADAHLKGKEDQGYRYLIDFLNILKNGDDDVSETNRESAGNISSSQTIRGIKDLYIAGDLFDFWFSKENRIYPGFEPIVDMLMALKNRGIHVHLCEGNHDFLLEDYFANILEMSTSEEWLTINLDGIRVLISHGDTIDQTNRPYLLLRKILRGKAIRFLTKWLPQPILWSIARKSSEISKANSRDFQNKLVEKMYQFALEKFAEDFDAVILGHCHVPVLRECFMGGRKKTFVTLGDWIAHHSYLYYANGRFELSYYKP